MSINRDEYSPRRGRSPDEGSDYIPSKRNRGENAESPDYAPGGALFMITQDQLNALKGRNPGIPANTPAEYYTWLLGPGRVVPSSNPTRDAASYFVPNSGDTVNTLHPVPSWNPPDDMSFNLVKAGILAMATAGIGGFLPGTTPAWATEAGLAGAGTFTDPASLAQIGQQAGLSGPSLEAFVANGSPTALAGGQPINWAASVAPLPGGTMPTNWLAGAEPSWMNMSGITPEAALAGEAAKAGFSWSNLANPSMVNLGNSAFNMDGTINPAFSGGGSEGGVPGGLPSARTSLSPVSDFLGANAKYAPLLGAGLGALIASNADKPEPFEGSTTTTQAFSPEEAAARAKIQAEAERLYGANASAAYPGATVVPFSADTLAAQNRLRSFSTGAGQDISNQLGGALKFGLKDVLYPESNPALQQVLNTTTRQIGEAYNSPTGPIANIRGGFTGANSAGSGTREGIAGGLAARSYLNTLGDVTGRITSDAYNRGLSTFSSTLASAPQTYATMQAPILGQAAVGAQQEAKSKEQADYDAASRMWSISNPADALQRYYAMIQGLSNPTRTTMTKASGGTANAYSGLGGALIGANLGSQFSKLFA